MIVKLTAQLKMRLPSCPFGISMSIGSMMG